MALARRPAVWNIRLKGHGGSELDVETLATPFVAARELLAIVAAGIALSSLDDIAIDLIYGGRWAWRRLTIYRRFRPATAATLPPKFPGRMAIFVPAWDESAVIGAMLRDLTARLDYPDYLVFVGVYPNDPATRHVVEAVDDARIRLVTTPRDGPTTKADCLNALWRAMLAEEDASGLCFRAIVLHDAEDVVHPRELRVFDHLIGRLSLIQLPVAPLPERSSRLVAGTYQDEFAEAHLKDLVVREAIGAAVPSAGVACAIDRAILGRIAADLGGDPFDAACVTEDYELGLRIHAMGGRGSLVRIRGGDGEASAVATREHFPSSFKAAVRQKSRWLLGIALQGWDRLGWHGGLANRLMLLRDRKAIPAALLTILAYLTFFLVLALEIVRAIHPAAHAFPPFAPPGELLRWLLIWNTGVLIWRLAVRAACVWAVYGPEEAKWLLPRALMGNMINIRAALRALRIYLGLSLGLSRLRWEKTEHRFPGADR